MQIPEEILTFFICMIPVVDIRIGIPIAISMGLTPMSAFFWGVAGNLTFTFIGMKLFDPITNFLSKHSKHCKRFFENLFSLTRRKHEENIEKYGPLFIMIFVAIPIPGSGALVGGLIGWLFGISFYRTFAYTAMGTVFAGALLALGFKSVTTIFNAFFG